MNIVHTDANSLSPQIAEDNLGAKISTGNRSAKKDAHGAGSQHAGDNLGVKLVAVNRVTKVVKGGRIFGFAALVVVGDGQGKVGFGTGKAKEVPIAIQKATDAAKRNMVTISLNHDTIWHPMKCTYGSSSIYMQPAAPGTGIIAGGALRAVLEMVGVRNILSKIYGSTHPINVVRAAIKGLRSMSSPKHVAEKRGKTVREIME